MPGHLCSMLLFLLGWAILTSLPLRLYIWKPGHVLWISCLKRRNEEKKKVETHQFYSGFQVRSCEWVPPTSWVFLVGAKVFIVTIHCSQKVLIPICVNRQPAGETSRPVLGEHPEAYRALFAASFFLFQRHRIASREERSTHAVNFAEALQHGVRISRSPLGVGFTFLGFSSIPCWGASLLGLLSLLLACQVLNSLPGLKVHNSRGGDSVSAVSRPDPAQTSSSCNRVWTASWGRSVLVWPAWGLWNHLMSEVHFWHSSSETVIHLKLLRLLIVLVPLWRVSTTGFLTFSRYGALYKFLESVTCGPCNSISCQVLFSFT